MQKRRAKRRVIEHQKMVTVFDDILTDNPNQGMGHQIPPLVGHVAIYFCQHNMSLGDAQSFYQYYENLEWKTITGSRKKIGKF